MKGRNLLIMGIILIIPVLVLIPFWGNCRMGKSSFPICVFLSWDAITSVFLISVGASKWRKQKNLKKTLLPNLNLCFHIKNLGKTLRIMLSKTFVNFFR